MFFFQLLAAGWLLGCKFVSTSKVHDGIHSATADPNSFRYILIRRAPGNLVSGPDPSRALDQVFALSVPGNQYLQVLDKGPRRFTAILSLHPWS